MSRLPQIVRRADAAGWQEVVLRKTGERIGWVRADRWGSMAIWDAYDADKTWVQGRRHQADAVQLVWIRWNKRRRESDHD